MPTTNRSRDAVWSENGVSVALERRVSHKSLKALIIWLSALIPDPYTASLLYRTPAPKSGQTVGELHNSVISPRCKNLTLQSVPSAFRQPPPHSWGKETGVDKCERRSPKLFSVKGFSAKKEIFTAFLHLLKSLSVGSKVYSGFIAWQRRLTEPQNLSAQF